MGRAITICASALVLVGLLSVGAIPNSRIAARQVDPTITAYETRVAELEGTVAALEAELATSGDMGTPVVDGDADLDPAKLVDRLLATGWTDEEFPSGDEADGEERIAFPDGDEDVADAVGGVGISWAGGPWTLSYLVYATEAGASDALTSALDEGVAAGLRVSVTSNDGVDGSCLGPAEVVPGSPDSETCLAVSENVLIVSLGDDHDASRVAFLLFAGLRHLDAVRGA